MSKVQRNRSVIATRSIRLTARKRASLAFIDYFRKRPAPSEPITTRGVPRDRRRKPRKSVAPGTTVLIIDDSKTMVAALGNMRREASIRH